MIVITFKCLVLVALQEKENGEIKGRWFAHAGDYEQFAFSLDFFYYYNVCIIQTVETKDQLPEICFGSK